MQHAEQDFAVVRMSYHFGECMANRVGKFRGYESLPSGLVQDWDFYKDFENFWLSQEKYWVKNLISPPRDAGYHEARTQGQKKYTRLALNVANGHSSPSAVGNSTVNYANVDFGITFLMYVVQNSNVAEKTS